MPNKNDEDLINICHLIGFKPEIDKEIHLDDEYKIRKLTEEENKLLRMYKRNLLFSGWKDCQEAHTFTQ